MMFIVNLLISQQNTGVVVVVVTDICNSSCSLLISNKNASLFHINTITNLAIRQHEKTKRCKRKSYH